MNGSIFSHSEECSKVHVGAHCLKVNDVRGAIVSLTSRMLDNPINGSGIYPTSEFYRAVEDYIVAVLEEVELAISTNGGQDIIERGNAGGSDRDNHLGYMDAVAHAQVIVRKRIKAILNEEARS